MCFCGLNTSLHSPYLDITKQIYAVWSTFSEIFKYWQRDTTWENDKPLWVDLVSRHKFLVTRNNCSNMLKAISGILCTTDTMNKIIHNIIIMIINQKYQWNIDGNDTELFGFIIRYHGYRSFWYVGHFIIEVQPIQSNLGSSNSTRLSAVLHGYYRSQRTRVIDPLLF